MFGIWFTFTLIQPTGMIGMTMAGDSASMTALTYVQRRADERDAHVDHAHGASGPASQTVAPSERALQASHTLPERSSAPPECDRHDCCCSAVPFATLSPAATLAWLPDHVIDQDPPRHGDFVAYTDGQHLLPFANGPPPPCLGLGSTADGPAHGCRSTPREHVIVSEVCVSHKL